MQCLRCVRVLYIFMQDIQLHWCPANDTHKHPNGDDMARIVQQNRTNDSRKIHVSFHSTVADNYHDDCPPAVHQLANFNWV